MKLAFVVSDISYPPIEGLHQQTLLLIQALRNRGHAVHLFGFLKDDSMVDEGALRRDLGISFVSPPIRYRGGSLLQAMKRVALKPFTRSPERDSPASLLRSGDFDLVHLDGTLACSLAPELPTTPIVQSWVDPGSRRYRRMAREASTRSGAAKNRVASALYGILEHQLTNNRTTWHFVSDEDVRYIAGRHPNQPVRAVPVMFPPSVRGGRDWAPQVNGAGTVVIFCDLRQPHMRSAFLAFSREVLQTSDAANEVNYVILGRVDADPELLAAMSGLDCNFLPWVDDYLQLLRSAAFVVLPDTTGTGLKNRAIQVLAAGIPLLATPVAVEGIPVVDGVHAAVASDADSVRRNFDRLVRDTTFRKLISKAGQELIASRYSEESVVKIWEATYVETIERHANLSAK